MQYKNNTSGFTLLEMLLALALGAMLMATISTSVIPLLKQTDTQGLNPDSYATEYQLQSFFDELDRLSTSSELAFPTALDSGIARNSLAVQFKGTGLDLPADANGDGVHGVANMDTAAIRATNTLLANEDEDDDRDGTDNEDPINGIDDDYDGLTDEDPGENANNGKNDVPGKENIDDNGDGRYDSVWAVTLSTAPTYWSPFLPTSLVSDVQLANSKTHTVWKSGLMYQWENDDNEDGVTNNSPLVTWSARLSGDTLICTTPLVTHDQVGHYSKFTYHEYVCMNNVSAFTATRKYSQAGSVLIELAMDYQVASDSHSVTKTLVFQ